MMDAGEAIWNLKIVAKVPPPAEFVGSTNSDLAFTGNYAIQGNYNGFQIWDISNSGAPDAGDGVRLPGVAERRLGLQEPAVRVRRGKRRPARLRRAGRAGHREHRAPARHPHLRHQRHRESEATSRTCRPAAARTRTRCVEDPKDKENVYIYVSGSAGLRSPNELAGCVAQRRTRSRTRRSSASRSSRCRSRIRSRPRS